MPELELARGLIETRDALDAAANESNVACETLNEQSKTLDQKIFATRAKSLDGVLRVNELISLLVEEQGVSDYELCISRAVRDDVEDMIAGR